MRAVSSVSLGLTGAIFFFAVTNSLLSITRVLVGSANVDFKVIKWFKDI